MWMLSFIPDAFLAWVVNIILLAGIIGFAAPFFFGYVIRFLPALAPYRILVQVVSIILLVAGVYLKGGYSVEMEWREKVAKLEQQVKEAEAKSAVVNEKIITVYKDKIKVLHDVQVVYQERIKEVEKKIDAECKVAPEAIDILNDAAKGAKK